MAYRSFFLAPAGRTCLSPFFLGHRPAALQIQKLPESPRRFDSRPGLLQFEPERRTRRVRSPQKSEKHLSFGVASAIFVYYPMSPACGHHVNSTLVMTLQLLGLHIPHSAHDQRNSELTIQPYCSLNSAKAGSSRRPVRHRLPQDPDLFPASVAQYRIYSPRLPNIE